MNPTISAAPPQLASLLDDVMLLELPDPEFLVSGIIQRKGISVLFGPPGGGKTTLVAQLLVAITTGEPFLGHKVNFKGSAVYMAAEDPSGFKIRVKTAKTFACLPLSEPLGIFTYPDAIDVREPAQLMAFAQQLKSFPFPQPLECLVIDTYAAVTPGSKENASEDVTRAVRAAQYLRDTLGCAVIYVHHSNASGTRERGHTALRGACDAMLSLVPVDDIVVLKSEKLRNASPLEPIELKLVPQAESDGACVLRRLTELPKTVWQPSPIQKAVLAVFEDMPEEGEQLFVVHQSCPDIPERSFFRAVKVLKNEGLIEKVGKKYRLVE